MAKTKFTTFHVEHHEEAVLAVLLDAIAEDPQGALEEWSFRYGKGEPARRPDTRTPWGRQVSRVLARNLSWALYTVPGGVALAKIEAA